MIDEIIVKNSDKIAILMKVSENNRDEIENLTNKARTKQEDIEKTMRKLVGQGFKQNKKLNQWNFPLRGRGGQRWVDFPLRKKK